MGKDHSEPLRFTSEHQILHPPDETYFPVPSGRWSRWMNLLRQSTNPPIWFSESLALFFLGVAVTSVAGALAVWPAVDFWTLSESGQPQPHLSAWLVESGFILGTISFSAIGLYVYFGNRHLRQQSANLTALVADEMESFAEDCAKAQRAQAKRQKTAQERGEESESATQS